MINHKGVYSQRRDDYLLEAQRMSGEDKPAPLCPYCGEKMRESGSISHRWYMCPYCLSAGPRKIIDMTGYSNEELAVVDATQKAREAAMQRWQKPNDYLVRAEVLDRCKQGAEARPLWVEFRRNDQRSRWMVVDTPPTVFGTDTVKNYFANKCEQYGILWRCWLRKPTQEEMEGTPWETK